MRAIMLLILVLLSNVAHAEHLEHTIVLDGKKVVVVFDHSNTKTTADEVKQILSSVESVLNLYSYELSTDSESVAYDISNTLVNLGGDRFGEVASVKY
jgi:uncharacterized protein YxeA